MAIINLVGLRLHMKDSRKPTETNEIVDFIRIGKSLYCVRELQLFSI